MLCQIFSDKRDIAGKATKSDAAAGAYAPGDRNHFILQVFFGQGFLSPDSLMCVRKGKITFFCHNTPQECFYV